MSGATPFPRTFSPLAVRHLLLRNRVMQTAHQKGYAVDGAESARDLAYYLARARGGVALLIIGGRFVHRSSEGPPHFASGYRPSIVAPDRRITRALRAQGVACFAQINHFGANAIDGVDELHEAWSASDVPSPMHGTVPRPLEEVDIPVLLDAWADSAELAVEGGYDGVELLMAHGYLVHQFLSPLFNHRDDRYGGPLENRARLACEILGAVRRRIGDDIVMGVRMPVADFLDGGLSENDVHAVVGLLGAHARVDFVNLTTGWPNAMPISPLAGPPDGYLAEYGGRLKRAVGDLPVFLVGNLRRPQDVEAILEAGQADVVGLTRQQIADPDWAEKARTGRASRITHCIRANQGCIARVAHGLPLTCTVNPLAGREAFFAGRMNPAGDARHWLVVGGGPAGLKAAETLARRGHRVTLAEASERLGGQVGLLLAAPGREDVGLLVSDLEREVRDLGVDVRLATPLDAAGVLDVGADAVLLATGARADARGFSPAALWRPTLPGHDQPHVVTGFDILRGAPAAGRRIAVLDDQGSRYTAAVVEVLLGRGHEVVHVTPMPTAFAPTAWTLDQPVIYGRVFGQNYRLRLNAWAARIEPPGVEVYDVYSRVPEVVETDAVVLVTQRRAEDGLYRDLAKAGVAAQRIGDCLAPRALDDAIFDGFVAGLELDRDELPQPGTLERWPLGVGAA